MKILLIDAVDSFVYIIANYLEKLGHDVDVLRMHQVCVDQIPVVYDFLILGPEPGHPRQSAYLEVIAACLGKMPIFGVCLGMLAIAEYFGIPVVQASSRRHGKVSPVEHLGVGCFSSLPSPLQVARYHSLVADRRCFPNPDLQITALSQDDGYVMGISNPQLAIEGVQFHPESIATESGLELLRNALDARLVTS